ncbi:MAG: VPS10 domain-containing protein [Calditrichia bacterium]
MRNQPAPVWAKVVSQLCSTLLLCMLLAGCEQQLEESPQPNDWFINQRAYPQGEIDLQVHLTGMAQASYLRSQQSLSQQTWQQAGPTNIGGRITDIEMDPTNTDVLFAGTATGGVWKSIDSGVSWNPIFDDQISLSIGDLAISASNPQIIYVGTGEVNGGGGSITYGGTGVYKSSNGGTSWTNVGLEETRFIGRVVIDPQNSDRVFVAAMGKLFSTNPERGLFRSLDGGTSWTNVLSISDSTGCVDVVIHPTQPDTVYAVAWQRTRTPEQRTYGGDECGIYRSVDGGDTWQEITHGLPTGPNVGRIGIAISQSSPQTLYSIYADRVGFFAGIYRTDDNGDSWMRTQDGNLNSMYSSFGWWFGNIRVDPNDPDIAFALGLNVYRTIDGGQSWIFRSGNMHVDQHGMAIHPQNSSFIVAGNDGGIYRSANGSDSWIKVNDLPITQFYTSEIDNQAPTRLYGGTQDNGTIRTFNGTPNTWSRIYGGDGFFVRVDPSNNTYVYAESQYGGLGRSTNGGSSFLSGRNGIPSGSNRNNWSSPLVLDPQYPEVLYFGTQRVYRSSNRAASWTPVSEDLSNGSSSGNLVFGTLTALEVSPVDSSVIWAGTDDGNVWIKRSGADWTLVSQNLPQRWITRVTAGRNNPGIAYATLSGYRVDEYLPHIFRTEDYGQNWIDISGNLPEVPLNDVLIDPQNDSTLYVASDAGVYSSTNLGLSWQAFGDGIPLVPVTDLTLHDETLTLVAATFGRSMFKIQLDRNTGIDGTDTEAASTFTLEQNYPNPFNPSTTIAYSLSEPSEHQIEIFNISGQKIRTLFHGMKSAGSHHEQWDGRNSVGSLAPSGIYIYRIRSKTFIAAKQMTLLK